MKKLIVGVNDAPWSTDAVTFAAQLADAVDGSLVLTHISKPLPRSARNTEAGNELNNIERRYVNDFLTDAAGNVGEVKVELVHKTGRPVEEFLKLLEPQDAWMAVLGARPREGFGKVIEAGFAHRIARTARKPVLITRGDPSRTPLVTMANHPPTFLVAVDGSAVARKTLDFALSLARPCGAAIHVTHVLEPVVVADAFTPSGDFLMAQEQFAEDVITEARKTLAPSGIKSTFAIRRGSPFVELDEEARKVSAAVIFAGDSGRGAAGRVLFGSVADRLVNFAHTPVLVYR